MGGAYLTIKGETPKIALETAKAMLARAENLGLHRVSVYAFYLDGKLIFATSKAEIPEGHNKEGNWKIVVHVHT